MKHIFPYDFVFWTNVENHKKIKEKFLPIALEKSNKISGQKPSSWKCDLTTSFLKQNQFNDFLVDNELVNSIVWDSVDKMFNEIEHLTIPSSSIIRESWFNAYQKGQNQEIHSHCSHNLFIDGKNYHQLYSLIYVADSKDKTNKTVFFKEKPIPGQEPHLDYVFDTGNESSITEGTVIIFPSHLLHYVRDAEDYRMTFSYNIISSFDHD